VIVKRRSKEARDAYAQGFEAGAWFMFKHGEAATRQAIASVCADPQPPADAPPTLDSPNFVPKELDAFAARGYQRVNRDAPKEERMRDDDPKMDHSPEGQARRAEAQARADKTLAPFTVPPPWRAPTVEEAPAVEKAQETLRAWFDSPCPHASDEDRAIAGDLSRNECLKCVDALVREAEQRGAERGYTNGALEERQRLVRIAVAYGAGTALAAVGFVRCKARHSETDQRCLKGEDHGGDSLDYVTHQSETVTWLEPRALPLVPEAGEGGGVKEAKP
jgi:hypothetical protein